MIRSPLHLLISLQRFLYRTKARHKSAFIFSRPITKSTSWSAAIALRIPRLSSTSTTAKPIPNSVQPSHQLLRLSQRQSSATRRLLISRQCPSHAVYVQSRTMLSSGNANNHQITTVLNPAQFFTPRPPILGVHVPPAPQSSLRSYVNHPPWANQQHQPMTTLPPSPSSAKVDMDDIDSEGDYDSNTRYQHTHQRLLTNTTSIAAQRPYRPPNMRGMADVMDNEGGIDHVEAAIRHSPGLVHRGQPPRKSRQKPTSTMSVLRHDDLSLQTTKKRRSSSTAMDDDDELDLTQHWYISIPMDMAFLMQSLTSAGNLFAMENAVSILDPVWMTSFDQWGKLIRSHLTKVMVLIRLVGVEAQRYYAKRPEIDNSNSWITPMDFKMMMMKESNTPSELRIYLPRQLCTPLPTTLQNLQQWVHDLMKDPPCFEIKYGTDGQGGDRTAQYNDLTRMGDLFEIPTGGMNHGERGMETDDLTESNDGDNDPWRIGPLYFQGIHSFLNHVDTMIDSSPAFATGSQRRSSL